MILTDYGSYTSDMPYQGEGYHGTFMTVTNYRGDVVYFNRDAGTGKSFIFDVESVKDKAEDNDIDIDRADIVVKEVQSGANGPCIIRYYAFEFKGYPEFLGRWCRGE